MLMLMIWLMNFEQGTPNMAGGNKVHLNKVYWCHTENGRGSHDSVPGAIARRND